ncbi:uncharacterized protein LOC111302697 [Durio zibethinus]|uniref:Uncharacterized protein LOC111302697 n=1 Tax=Durio zibethinus TaxID=66656 RepID=A0A6P5ZN25_DURZI|nr:uncharacterized protein LOC111302697 [Durio zibethinus]
MTRPVLMRAPPVTRRQPVLLSEDPKTARKGNKFGAVVGGTVAECTAVFCCCPFSVMELLVLGLYKVPAGLCKKVWKRRKRQRLMKKNPGFLGPAKVGPPRAELEAEPDQVVGKGARCGDDQDDGCAGAVHLEKEMWDRFYGTGFWRSPSQRET